jgi:hypothetical protein
MATTLAPWVNPVQSLPLGEGAVAYQVEVSKPFAPTKLTPPGKEQYGFRGCLYRSRRSANRAGEDRPRPARRRGKARAPLPPRQGLHRGPKLVCPPDTVRLRPRPLWVDSPAGREGKSVVPGGEEEHPMSNPQPRTGRQVSRCRLNASQASRRAGRPASTARRTCAPLPVGRRPWGRGVLARLLQAWEPAGARGQSAASAGGVPGHAAGTGAVHLPGGEQVHGHGRVERAGRAGEAEAAPLGHGAGPAVPRRPGAAPGRGRAAGGRAGQARGGRRRGHMVPAAGRASSRPAGGVLAAPAPRPSAARRSRFAEHVGLAPHTQSPPAGSEVPRAPHRASPLSAAGARVHAPAHRPRPARAPRPPGTGARGARVSGVTPYAGPACFSAPSLAPSGIPCPPALPENAHCTSAIPCSPHPTPGPGRIRVPGCLLSPAVPGVRAQALVGHWPTLHAPESPTTHPSPCAPLWRGQVGREAGAIPATQGHLGWISHGLSSLASPCCDLLLYSLPAIQQRFSEFFSRP